MNFHYWRNRKILWWDNKQEYGSILKICIKHDDTLIDFHKTIFEYLYEQMWITKRNMEINKYESPSENDYVQTWFKKYCLDK